MMVCPICGADSEPSISAEDENHRVSPDAFLYATCRVCRTIFLANPPVDIARYYEAEYYHIPSLERLEAIGAKDRSKIEIVNRFANGRRLLEIGPAFGVFARQAMLEGYSVDVVEMDQRCCDYLRSKVGVGVTQSDRPEQVIRTLPRHDIIVLWHVLEHLRHIPSVIEAAAMNLVPGGILVIATPNPEATQFGWMGKHWPHLDAPRHLVLLPSQALAGLGAAHGLSVEFLTTDDSDARHWNIFGWQRLLMNRVRLRMLKRAMFVIGNVVGFIMSPWDRKFARGSAYTMILKKLGA